MPMWYEFCDMLSMSTFNFQHKNYENIVCPACLPTYLNFSRADGIAFPLSALLVGYTSSCFSKTQLHAFGSFFIITKLTCSFGLSLFFYYSCTLFIILLYVMSPHEMKKKLHVNHTCCDHARLKFLV